MTFNILMVIPSVLHHLQNNPMKDKKRFNFPSIKKDYRGRVKVFSGSLIGHRPVPHSQKKSDFQK